MKIKIIKAKPNPAGKDKNREKPLTSQLLAETVDLKNEGDVDVALEKCRLAHTKFDTNGNAEPVPAIYWKGADLRLKPGQTVRIHTGKSADEANMAAEDRSGVAYHSFAESGSFVLNNKEGDRLYLTQENSTGKSESIDTTFYDSNPPEGETLIREGAKLVPAKLGGSTKPWSAPAVIGSSGKAA